MRAAADANNPPEDPQAAPPPEPDPDPIPVADGTPGDNGHPVAVVEAPVALPVAPPVESPVLVAPVVENAVGEVPVEPLPASEAPVEVPVAPVGPVAAVLTEPSPPAVQEMPVEALVAPVVVDPRAAPGVDPAGAEPVERGWTRYSLWVLLALTLLGGYLRFAWIDRPPLWTDESYTFRRISGTYQELLDVLQTDGFGPLHYQLYWWLAHKAGRAWSDPALMTSADYAKQVVGMTPFWMRFFPSLLGTLMVPAMYFLARQMTSRRTSLLVAAFTACSAFMMVYSHDAKMYMMLWFFGALSAACLLWWFRTDLRVAWLAWVASTLAMVGTHAPGFVLLAIYPIFLVTQRRMHWKKFVLFALGLAVVASGPAVHFGRFNKWVDKIEDEGWNSASGLAWVPGVLRGRSGSEMVLYVGSAYLFSWEWPRADYRDDDPTNKSYRNDASGFQLMLQGFNLNPKVFTGLMTAVVAVLAFCAIGALPWSRRLRGETLDDQPTQPWWRTTFWLAAWLAIPAYGMYCASVKGMGQEYAKPREWVDHVGALFHDRWVVVSVVIVLLFALCCFFRKVPVILAGSAGVILLLTLVHALLPVTFTRPVGTEGGRASWEFIEWWRIGRLVGNRWYDALTHPFAITAGVLLLPPVAWYFSGRTTWERLLRAFQMLLIVAGIYACCVGVYEYLLKNPPKNDGPVWMPRYVGMVWPAFAIAVCALVMRVPTRPLRWAAIALLLGVNTGQSLARMFWGTEPRLDLMYAEVKRSQDRDGNFRVYIEPAQNMTNHPAGANLTSNQAKYYAALARGESWSPQSYRGANVRDLVFYSTVTPAGIAADVRRSPKLDHVVVWDRLDEVEDLPGRLAALRKALYSARANIPYTVDGHAYGPQSVAQLEAAVAALEKRIQAPEPDPVLVALGQGWRMEPVQYHPVRYHWNWSEMYVNRRREYRKVGAAQ